MTGYRTLDDLDVKGQRVLLRLDLNVPMDGGRISDTTRIERAMPTADALASRGARVVMLSHFGRPKGKTVPDMSLRPLVDACSTALGRFVAFAGDCIGPVAEQAVASLQNGDVLLLENLRFHAGEEADNPVFADALAGLGDIFVNDAFSAAHRAHASVVGLAQRLPAAAGLLMAEELDALDKALGHPERPLAAVVGGAKVSTKLDLLGNLVDRVDVLAIGGGMANTFLHAEGVEIGKSLCEHDMADTARAVLVRAEEAGCEIILPVDAVTAEKFEANAPSQVVAVEHVEANAMILDIGPESAAAVARRLADCRTLVWNGPMGAFELDGFDGGTNTVARAAAELSRKGKLLTVAGGGDTVAALAHAGVLQDFTYVSTAGGAFLEWLEGKELPGVAALSQS